MRHLIAIAVIFCCALRATAQPLVDSIPSDAVIYASWSGTSDMGDGYEGSHLQAVMQASSMTDLLGRVMPALADMAAMEDPDAGAAIDMFSSLAGAAFRYPTAFYLAPIGVEGDEPDIKFAIICDAGEDAPQLAQQLKLALDEAGGSPVPINIANWGGRLAVQVGNIKPMAQTRLGGPLRIVPAPSLKDHKPFQEAMAKVQGDMRLAVYVDVAAIMATVDAAAAKEAAQFAERFPNQKNEAADWPKLRDALGLTSLRRVAIASGLEDKQWTDRLFIDAPSPRKGIVKLLDSKTLSQDMLKLIPQDAAMAAVGQLDLGAVLDEVRAVGEAMEPGSSQQINDAIANIEAQTGINVETGLIKAFGHEWAYYTSPTVGGRSVAGLVLMNKPSDAEALQNTLNTMVAMANQIIAMQTAELPFELQLRTMEVDGITITYIPAFLASPCWALKDGVMYAALYPQVLVSALARKNDTSILDNDRFTGLWKKADGKPGAASWVDLEQLAPEGYQGMLMLSSLMEGGASAVGQPTPLVLPPLHQLLPHIKPAASFAWSDDAGYYVRSTSSFPGVSLLATQSGNALYQQASMIGILLPALGAARKTATQMELQSQAKGVAVSLFTYAADNDDKLPPSLIELVNGGYVPAEMLQHTMVEGPAPEQIDQAWLDEVGAFAYVAKPGTKLGDIANPSEYVLFYEHTGWLEGDRATVAYADGHVEIVHIDELDGQLMQQLGKTTYEIEGWGEMDEEAPMTPAAP
jgi:prepilin-type processing-associated H-X9-DG protein